MSKSKPTREYAFGLRIVSSGREHWHWFTHLGVMASDLSLRLYRATQRVDHRTDRGSRVPFTVVDVNGTRISCIRNTPYQAEHTQYGATWRSRTEWTSYEPFDSKGKPLQIHRVLRAFDLEGHLNSPKKWQINHGERGRGSVPYTHKSRGGFGWFRAIRTHQEGRLNALVLQSEGEVPVRPARNMKNLPTAWDDLMRVPQRSWKEQSKAGKQWLR